MADAPGYLIEYTRVGVQVRVAACDPESGLEAVVMVPANMSQKDMAQVAIRKLQYIKDKKPSS